MGRKKEGNIGNTGNKRNRGNRGNSGKEGRVEKSKSPRAKEWKNVHETGFLQRRSLVEQSQ